MSKGTQNARDTIYVALMNEGVRVWRPATALKIESDIYKIDDDLMVEKDENWEFVPGDVVRCKEIVFSGGSRGLVAVELASNVI